MASIQLYFVYMQHRIFSATPVTAVAAIGGVTVMLDNDEPRLIESTKDFS